ncbi:MAG: AAA family ATPase [Blastocatellia bacterium]
MNKREPLPGLAVYNPSLLRKEDLIAQFVARRPLLDRLVVELRDGYQHQLIVGPRGSGKTTLLRRLQFAIEDDPELNARWVPLVFPEEQYNVSRLSDLWANCLDALSDLLERRGREAEAGSLDDQIESLPADEKRRAKVALDLLVGWAKKEERGLVLLFDNSDLIFDRLKKEHWAIREVLSADNHLLFIGATSAPIEATYNHKGAFYDFFNIRDMRRLTDDETLAVIRNLAELRGTKHVTDILDHDPGRIRSLNVLTGGNLRTVVVLYQVLAQGTDDSIRNDLEQLLDRYTPLYKHRFEALSAQSQQVVDALALNWDPSTAADLAGKLRVKTNAVSAVLDRLVNDGVIEKAPSPPGEKTFFQITERFFNIWYLMRASRRVRGKLLWLVRFLKMFYGAPGLLRRARHLVQDAPPREHDQSHRAELALAYAEAVGEPDLRRALINEGVRTLMSQDAEYRRSIKAMFDFEGEDATLKPVVERFQTQFIREGDDEFHETYWAEIIAFFRDAVATGHAAEAVALLDETEYGERWRPLREALRAIAGDDSSYLLRVAPEVRLPAEEIVAMLLPEGVRLGSAPKPARKPRTRRKLP